MNGEIVALLPVKAQSERVVSKNTRPFHDTSLYELKLNQLLKVKCFAKIIVSSEDDHILEIARKKGYDVHRRNPKYSTSFVPMSEVYSHIASEIPGEHIAWVNVTNPLITGEVYERAVEVYRNLDSTYDCLLSVHEVRHYLFHNGKPLNFTRTPWLRSQDLKGVCAMSFAINILRSQDMVRWGSCVGHHPYLFHLDPIDSIDIDFQEEFDFCEMIYKQRCLKNTETALRK